MTLPIGRGFSCMSEVTMKLIKRNLPRYVARQVRLAHNRRHHDGKPTAHIDPDELNKSGRLPRYKVWCPVCEDVNEGDSLDGVAGGGVASSGIEG